MDMTWKSMLHEAAAASFEKDIKSFAVDSISYSCVDLPQARIREMSEKILLLPHHGIVLLFSRYCFRLSPEETEMFFQLKNAKGHFRFYCALLSSCMGLAENQMISDASFSKACKAALKNYLRAELKEGIFDKTYKRSKLSVPLRKIGKAVAVAVITLTLLFSTCMVANAQFREKVIDWVIETFEKYSIFELKSDGENAQLDLMAYKATYIPDGALLLNTIKQPDVIKYEYAVGNADDFSILICKTDTRIYMDTENSKIEPVSIDGAMGYLFERDSRKYVCFEKEGCYFAVFGSLDADGILMVASGIKKSDN